ncbi:hypothetical protein IAU60_002335 [Kwoniella sp. DSM 27419]
MAKACSVCGSRKWRKDKVTGSAVCEEGHVRQDYRSETMVTEPTGGPSFHLVKRKTGRKEKGYTQRELGRKNPDFYHGQEAEYLRMQGLQIMLRLQVQALSKLWSLPDTLETIVRDLWAYQLAISTLPSVPEPSRRSRSPTPPQAQTNSRQADAVPDIEMANGEDDKSGSSDNGSENDKHDSTGSEPDADSEIEAEMLQRIEEDSDQSKGEGSDVEDGDRTLGVEDGKNGWRRRRLLRVSDTLVTLMVGLWILRVPVMAADLEDLINNSTLPYIDFANTTYLSDEMKKHMNGHVSIALSPLRSPSASTLHRACKKFARQLDMRFGIVIPEINIHPVAWRIVSALGGTPTTYVQTVQLMTVLDLNMSLLEREIETIRRRRARRSGKSRRFSMDDSDEDDSGGNPRKMESYEKTIKYLDTVAPELAIAATWVIVLKMTYGLDTVPRQALLQTDPLIGLADGPSWMKELRARVGNGVLRRTVADLKPYDHINMDVDDLDAFLDRCQHALLDHRPELPDASPFPLPASQAASETIITPNSWDAFHAQVPTMGHQPLDTATNTNKALPLMPGEKVRSYLSSEPLLGMSSDLEVVLQAASEVVGWDRSELLHGMEHLERKMDHIRPKNDYREVMELDADRERSTADPSRASAEGLVRSRSVAGLRRTGSARATSLAPERSRSRARARAAMMPGRPGSRAGSRSRPASPSDESSRPTSRQGRSRVVSRSGTPDSNVGMVPVAGARVTRSRSRDGGLSRSQSDLGSKIRAVGLARSESGPGRLRTARVG